MANLEFGEKLNLSSINNKTLTESELTFPEEDKNSDYIQNEKKNDEDILVEKTIDKWLNLQKTIKEEITLEDVIIKQQETDKENLKSFFVQYYNIKSHTRKNYTDIKKLKLDEKQTNEIEYKIKADLSDFHTATEAIKNIFFIFRNNYDYLTRLLSLITPEDFKKNLDNITSLVDLLNNTFYENILIPNPEQQELLILIYKLLEEQIIPMGGVCPQNFLKDDTFVGIFLSSFSKKQEIIEYFSMLLNSLILSIDDDDQKECYDMSINNIVKSKNTTEKKKDIKIEELFDKIKKIKIKFKNSFELEAEKEKEDEMKFSLDNDNSDDFENNKDYNKNSRTQNDNIKLKDKDNEYNNEYKRELTQNELMEKIMKENNPELKLVYIKLLEKTNYNPNKYTYEGLIKILRVEKEKEKNKNVVGNYKENFIFIRDTIEKLLQLIIDKIITLPYPLRCICKIIKILITKKFPYLSKYEVNSYIGKFILDKCIFPILRLENKIFLDPRLYSKETKNCLDVIISVLSKANNSLLFDTYSDPEKTIFNPFILEIIPILNKIYEKIIDVKLPKIIDNLLNKTLKTLDETPKKKFFNFRNIKPKIEGKETSPGTKKISDNNSNSQSQLFSYFKENPYEILHLQSVCFTVDDLIFIVELIGRDKNNIELFKDLPKYAFFTKTYTRIKNEIKILNELSKKDAETQQKILYVIFKDEKNTILEQLAEQKKKSNLKFESNEQDSELICKRVKFCIKTILKGLNLLNIKDFAYLNFAQSSDKFFSALKYTLEESGEYSELSNDIPLKWYSQYIYNYKKELDDEYQNDDFSKLYSEISNEEINILNELKKLSSIVITRYGMNLRCAEKILERSTYELRRIDEAKKYNQLEKFINSKKIEVCIIAEEKFKNLDTEKIFPVIINEIKQCPINNASDKPHCHINNINDFIELFSEKSRLKLKEMVKMDIGKGLRKYKLSEIISNYMDIVMKKMKENKDIFREFKKEEEIKGFYKKIENHIIRKIYKYTFPNINVSSEDDKKIYELTQNLEWIKPENLDIKKLYVNQLKFAEKYLKSIDKARSVFDKLDCLQNAYVIMNNTVKFISGKNENAGQDELTPLFQYILIKSQPKKLCTNINYIRCFLSEADLMGQNGFYLSQMESTKTFLLNLKAKDLKIDENEFQQKIEKCKKI